MKKSVLGMMATLLAAAILLSACGSAAPAAASPAAAPSSSEDAASSEAAAPSVAAVSEASQTAASSDAAVSFEAAASTGTASSQAAPAAGSEAASAAPAAKSGKFAGPVLLTSAGQSADLAMMEKILAKLGVSYTSDATAKEVGSNQTVVIVPGVSTKGLGAAGLSADDELKRAAAFAKTAADSGASVVVAHVGGGNRRDDLSNKFIDAVLPFADYIVALDGSDEDGKFSNYASAHGVGIIKAASLAKLTEAVTGLFS